MELWTKSHIKTLLPTIAVMIILAIVLKLTIGKKEEKIRMIPFQIVAVMLVVLEVIKQALAIADGYTDLYKLPFHFCSLFIFFPIITAFYKGKFKDNIRSFTTTTLAMLTILMLVYPQLIYPEWQIIECFDHFFNFHT
ncbi:MAG: YwaF family protein, partial [Clostridia bacterium]|nr:YwaF family protein [Clostridia bacterium]